MTKPATWLTAQNLSRLIILIADLVKEQCLLPFTFLFFECLVRLIEPFVYIPMLISVFILFVLPCAGSYCLGFTGRCP